MQKVEEITESDWDFHEKELIGLVEELIMGRLDTQTRLKTAKSIIRDLFYFMKSVSEKSQK